MDPLTEAGEGDRVDIALAVLAAMPESGDFPTALVESINSIGEAREWVEICARNGAPTQGLSAGL